MQWWRVVGAIGRFMMRAGVLVLLFVAYQLWGTGFATQRAQNDLAKQFASQQASTTTTSSPSTTATTAGTTPTTAADGTAPADLPPPPTGGLVGRIQIDRIGADFYIVQGVDLESLKKGPGHYPQTPMPGQPGNAALAGHRTTYLAPFNRIDELQPGDPIVITTAQGTFTYLVDPHVNRPGAAPEGHFIVSPDQVEILDPPPAGVNRLTLTSCNPKYSARQRIVVTATLQTPPAPATPTATATSSSPSTVTTDASVDSLAGGDPSAWPAAVAWSLAAVALWFAAWLVARLVIRRWPRWGRWSRVPVYLVALPFFTIALFLAYENIARLLPAAF